jgi:hypothetical protein
MNEWIIERVDCCVCHATGKVPKLLFWTKECPVCEGEGRRKILLHSALSPFDRLMVMESARTGSMNLSPPTLSEQILGFRL